MVFSTTVAMPQKKNPLINLFLLVTDVSKLFKVSKLTKSIKLNTEKKIDSSGCRLLREVGFNTNEKWNG